MSWVDTTLGAVCELQMGGTPSRKNPSYWDKAKETENIWLSIADLLNTTDGLVMDSREYLSDEGAKRIKIIPKGTLLMSFKLTLGRLAIAGTDLRTNEAIIAMQIKKGSNLELGYLKYFLESVDFEKLTEGSRKVKGLTLNKEKLSKIKLRYPTDIEKQRQIVGKLERSVALVKSAKEQTEEIVGYYDDLLKSIIAEALQG